MLLKHPSSESAKNNYLEISQASMNLVFIARPIRLKTYIHALATL